MNKFPLGIIMRFIPHISKVSIKREPTLSKWRYKQRLFTESIQDPSRPMMTRTWEINDLDNDNNFQPSIRKILMEVKSQDNDNEYIFLSVDFSFFRKKEVLFTFLPRHETEARGFVTNIIPYIRHRHPTLPINHIFVKEAVERNRDSIWNADTQEIISSADLYLEQTSKVAENFNMIEALGILTDDQHMRIPITKDHEKVQQLFLGDDNTSVGTLFTTVQNDLNTSSSIYNHNNITPSTTTARSQGTTLTIEEVDHKLNTLSTDMQKLHQLIHSLLNTQPYQQNAGNTATSQSQQVTGDPMEATCEAT